MASIFTLPWADIGAGIKPADGALLNFYDTGTYNRRDTYTDAGAGTPHANPVVADANGVFPAIYLDGTYRVVLTDKNAVQYEEADGVFSTSGDVAANAANIATNTADIATNASDIATNSASISANALVPATLGTITGLMPSNAADADHDITISAGIAADSTSAELLELSSAMTKQIDNSWVAGDGLGGLATGTVAADTTYHYFIIKKDSDDSIDVVIDTSITCANIPTGYTKYRRVFSLLTDSSANIPAFTAISEGGGVRVNLNSRVLDVNTTAPTAVPVLFTVSTPLDIELTVRGTVQLVYSGTCGFLITSPSETNNNASSSNNTVRTLASVDISNSYFEKITNTSAQLRHDSEIFTVTSLIIATEGWSDSRGQ